MPAIARHSTSRNRCRMCRTYSRGSKDIRGVGEDVRPEKRRQGFQCHQLHRPVECTLEQFRQSDESVEGLLPRSELDEKIHVAVGSRSSMQDRSEQRQAADPEAFDLGLGTYDAGLDLGGRRERRGCGDHRLESTRIGSRVGIAGLTPAGRRRIFRGGPVSTSWIVERSANRRLPFRISIEQDGRLILAVRAQAQWPGPGQNIFCLRERELDPAEVLEELQRVPVVALNHVGRKLAVALDRPQRKRCEFLTVRKPRRDGAGTYEQVFFRTESAIRAHRSRSRVELRDAPGTLAVVVDSAERYPWRFPGATVSRRKLAVGDYGLLAGERLVAVVERKSFDNLLTDVGALQALHQQLADLASVSTAALVIEAEYRDFLDSARLDGRWPATHLARVLGELSALHPRLPIVYAGNRKMANAWTHQFFRSLGARHAAPTPQLVMEAVARYDAVPRQPGLDERIRDAALNELPQPFAFAALAARFPDVSAPRLRRVVGQLRKEGRLTRTGSGRAARWGGARGPGVRDTG